MRYSDYQAALPFYLRRRELNPIAVANPEWMKQWFARHDEHTRHVDELMAAGRWAECTAFIKANPAVRITEETVKSPVPALVYNITVPEQREGMDF